MNLLELLSKIHIKDRNTLEKLEMVELGGMCSVDCEKIFDRLMQDDFKKAFSQVLGEYNYEEIITKVDNEIITNIVNLFDDFIKFMNEEDVVYINKYEKFHINKYEKFNYCLNHLLTIKVYWFTVSAYKIFIAIE